jgi:uncharacterized protein (UPF0548 family)
MPVERFDALCQPLPGEPPGEPVPDGPWAIARQLVEQYRMADPAIVRARWDRHAAFVGRVMVLQLRLWRLLSVRARVRVTRVWNEHRIVDGRRARVFGFEYETLPGHLELGRMDYELFGRREQVRFYFRCCARVARLTTSALGLPDHTPPPAVRLRMQPQLS